jgi:hypothetical protein
MRIQVELDEQGVAIVNKVREMTGLNTYKELFNNAITLLDWAARQTYKGLSIAAADGQKQEYRELEMPALQYAATKGQLERELLRQQGVAARDSAEAKAVDR